MQLPPYPEKARERGTEVRGLPRGAERGKCTVAIDADHDDELVVAAVQHAIAAHQKRHTTGLRKGIREHIKPGSPPAGGPTRAKHRTLHPE
jgi:predicted small metal-binding protein